MKSLLLCLGLCCLQLLSAQTIVRGKPLLSWDDFVVEYLESRGVDEDSPSPIDRGGTTLDYLEEQHRNPLNLNLATRQDLLALSFLSAPQVDSILAYRSHLRVFSSPSDLMMVHGLEAQQLRWLSLFVEIGDTLRPQFSWREQLRQARHSVEWRAQLPLPLSPHFSRQPSTATALKHRFLGLPWSNVLRYRVQSQQLWRAGLTSDQDVGEPFAAYRNLPFDHTSIFVEKHLAHQQGKIIVGDYHAQFAQGLLVGHRFATFIQPYFFDLPRRLTRISPNTSTDEAHFLRGIAWQQQKGAFQWTAFVSYRRQDASIENGMVKTLYENGLHRNAFERSHMSTLGNLQYGVHLSWQPTATQWGIGFVGSHFSQSFPSIRTFRSIPSPMVGNTALGLSLDFAHYARAWSIQSEFTLNQRGSTAFATFLRCQLSSTDVLLLQLRHFSAHNAAPAARTFQQGAHVQNEWGGLLGYETAFGRKVRWQSFLQFDHHPLPTWRAAAPSSGFVGQTLFTYAPHRAQQWSLRYRLTSRQQTIPRYAPLLQWVTRQSFRLLYQRNFGDFSLQTAADATASRQQLHSAQHYGVMLSLRLRYAPQTAWHASGFVSLFSSDSFSSRLYAYQPQLPGAGAFPCFYGTGCSGVAIVSWTPSHAWSISTRLALTHHWHIATSALSTLSSPETVPPSSSVQSSSPSTFCLHCGLWLRYSF